jgi:hypothetical protein
MYSIVIPQENQGVDFDVINSKNSYIFQFFCIIIVIITGFCAFCTAESTSKPLLLEVLTISLLIMKLLLMFLTRF